MLSLAVSLFLLQATLAYGDVIEVNNGGKWGEWGPMATCPPGTAARAFSLKVEEPQGWGDDTALNGIELYCGVPRSYDIKGSVSSSSGEWGTWNDKQWCPFEYLTAFSLRVEPQVTDNTAANNIQFRCSSRAELMGNGANWGSFGSWSGTCLKGICGIRTKVERRQGAGDDTALNDVQFLCC
ncbi:vitelline membrane outer layer protein 1 homolog [Hyperolius riggenbachi]|uniref:vitelline membrane outer layer protein 1 homolog n=1 Tax=Hyperolius riggenbachi TaxID=752182 RepID=UPI0035A38E1F